MGRASQRSIVFSSRFARARISLNCKRALPCSGRRCVCAAVSLVFSRRSASRPRVTCVDVNARVVLRCACLCFWRALGQSAQAEQDTLILCRKQESVVVRSTVPAISCENVSNWAFRFGSKMKAPKHVFLGGEVVATMSYDNDLRTILEAL